MKLAFFYDQSLLVRASVASVWEAIVFGLILSILILYLFLKNWGSTIVATLVIPVTVLITLVAMKLLGMTFNLMTLGGIAAAIGLVIDDAIVVVEAIYTSMAQGRPRLDRRAYLRRCWKLGAWPRRFGPFGPSADRANARRWSGRLREAL